MDHALDFRSRVEHGVKGGAPTVAAAPLTEVDAARKFAHYQQVRAVQGLRLDRRGVDELRVETHRPQVREQPEALAQAQQALLGTHRSGRVIPLRAAHSTKEHGT